MGDNNSANSTLTSNSDITDSASSGPKLQFRTIITRNPITRRFHRYMQVREMSVAIDVGFLFQQFVFARAKKKPYDRYKGWEDEGLWFKVLEVVNNSSFGKHTMSDLLQVFRTYQRSYKHDPALSNVHEELRTKLLFVFEKRWENAGVPFIPDSLEERFHGEGSNKAVNPPREHIFDGYASLSSYTGGDMVWEESYTARNAIIARVEAKQKQENSNSAAQFCKETTGIGIPPRDVGKMAALFPPDSYQYMVASSMLDEDSRLEALKGMHECLSILCKSHPESSTELSDSTSLKRKNKRRSS